jgi:hypothetical protein
MAAVIAVAGPACQVAAPHGLAGGATGNRGGVQQPPLVTSRRAGDGQGVQDAGDQRRGPAQPAVVGGLAAHVGEQVPRPAGHRPQPATLGGIAQQDLSDARQISSASDSLGGRPGPRRGSSRSSVVTYSAVTRSSRAACTRPPWGSRCGSNVNSRRPRIACHAMSPSTEYDISDLAPKAPGEPRRTPPRSRTMPRPTRRCRPTQG